MAPRSKSPARRTSTPRKSTSSSIASAVTNMVPSIVLGSPSKTRGATTTSSSRSSKSQTALFLTIQYMVGTLLASLALTWVTLRFNLLSRFVCPLLQKIYLEPIGWQALKVQGLIFLNLACYCMTTFLILPLLTYLAIPLCCGITPDTSDPKSQKNRLGGLCYRLGNAQMNMAEGLGLLVATLMAAMATGVPQNIVSEVTTFYVMIRQVYILAYALDQCMLRTVSWMSSIMACIYLLYLSIIRCF